MKIAIVGTSVEFEEFSQKFGKTHECIHFEDYQFLNQTGDIEVIFDFSISDNPENYSNYESGVDIPIFLNTVKMTLAELAIYYQFNEEMCYGFNGLPTFVNRDIIEVSTLSEKPNTKIFEQLATDFQFVDDRVGMVTPRIICMIINEAFYTIQEGTASKEDIDLGMKLGTNYPMGPFEWSEKLGVANVYELLEALHEDTKEERYKISAALKQAYLKSQRLTLQ